MKRDKRIIKVLVGIVLAIVTCFSIQGVGFAEDGDGNGEGDGARLTMSPMNQKIVLTAGSSYRGSFKVTNPGDNTMNLNYVVTVKPFRVDDQYNVIFENNGDYNRITEWIKLDKTEGSVAPNATEEIKFTVDVPNDAPAGGQYAALAVKSVNDNKKEDAVNIQAQYEIAHIVYAEVAGETKRSGTVSDVKVAGFLLNPPITASARVTNNGNVHSDAKYKLQVFPLFSNEEVYTNEEKPEVKTILPGATRYNEIAWEKAPSLGIFKTVFTVEFEDTVSKTEKIIVICPVWLLVVIFILIFVLVFWLVMTSRKASKKKESK